MDLVACRKNTHQFCFCCARYVYAKQRVPFDEKIQKKYKSTFNLKKIMNVDENFTPKIVCKTCVKKISSGSKSKINNLKTPAIWNKPMDNHSDCYLCIHNLSPSDIRRSMSRKTKNNKNPFVYQEGYSVILPVTFKQAESMNKVANPQSNKKDAEMDTSNKMESSDEE